MLEGFESRTETRRVGNTAGTSDTYWYAPNGKKFRSRAEIARHLKLDGAPGKRAKRSAREKDVLPDIDPDDGA